MEEESALNRRFRTNMKRLREDLGWSQAELSRRLIESGWTVFHQTTVARIEGGQRPVRIDEADAIAQVLGVRLSDLMGTEEDLSLRLAIGGMAGREEELRRAVADYLQAQADLARIAGEDESAQCWYWLGRSPVDVVESAVKSAIGAEEADPGDVLAGREVWPDDSGGHLYARGETANGEHPAQA